MNDPNAPAITEWFFRIAAVLGMTILFVLCVKLVLIAATPAVNKTISSDIGRRLVSQVPGQ